MREGLWKWPKSQKDGWDRSMTIIDTHLRRKWRSSTTLCCFHFCFDGESGGEEAQIPGAAAHKNLMMSFAAFQLSDSQELLASQENFTTFLNTQNTASENLNCE